MKLLMMAIWCIIGIILLIAFINQEKYTQDVCIKYSAALALVVLTVAAIGGDD